MIHQAFGPASVMRPSTLFANYAIAALGKFDKRICTLAIVEVLVSYL
jgi:hypothetical protein